MRDIFDNARIEGVLLKSITTFVDFVNGVSCTANGFYRENYRGRSLAV